MNVAWREMQRQPGRFVTATVILALLSTLLMLLGGLLDGLLDGSTSAVASQRGNVIVFSSTAESSFVRSRITPQERATIEQVPGVAMTGGIGVAQLGARVPGNGPRDLANIALFGYELAPKGVPDPPSMGEAYADRSLERDGIRTGMTIAVGPNRTPIRVVGMVDGLAYSGQGTMWASGETWRETINANLPAGRVAPDAFQSLVVKIDPGASAAELARRIDKATLGATQSLTIAPAVNAIPGVAQQRSTFNQIIGITVAIAIVVVALFFALLTVERTALYGVFKALGATSRTLFAGVVLQGVVVTLIASLFGAAIAILLGVLIPPGTIPFVLLPGRVISSVLFLLGAAVLGCAFSLRRVLRIDPASAIGTAQ